MRDALSVVQTAVSIYMWNICEIDHVKLINRKSDKLYDACYFRLRFLFH